MNGSPAGNQPARPAGRPRSEEADRAILRGALELLTEAGFQDMTIEGIAERAGVGKTTIYRRYASKEEILAAVVRTVHREDPVPDTGSAHDDLFAIAAAYRKQTVGSEAFPVLRYVLSVALIDDTVMQALREHVLKARQRALRVILERGIARGEVRPDVDLEFTLNVFPAMVIFQIVFNMQPGDKTALEDVSGRLVQMFWDFVRAPGTE